MRCPHNMERSSSPPPPTIPSSDIILYLVVLVTFTLAPLLGLCTDYSNSAPTLPSLHLLGLFHCVNYFIYTCHFWDVTLSRPRLNFYSSPPPPPPPRWSLLLSYKLHSKGDGGGGFQCKRGEDADQEVRLIPIIWVWLKFFLDPLEIPMSYSGFSEAEGCENIIR